MTFDKIVFSIGTARKEYPLAGVALEKREFEIEGNIVKVDKVQHLVYGWASITEVGGKPLVDTQGDVITTDTLEEAANNFVLHARAAGEMHETKKDGDVYKVGALVESVVFTKEKQQAILKSLKDQDIHADLDLGCVGWWIGFKISDDATWKKIVDGDLKAFSIGGKGKRAAIE